MRVLVHQPKKYKLALELCKLMGWHGVAWSVWNGRLTIDQLEDLVKLAAKRNEEHDQRRSV